MPFDDSLTRFELFKLFMVGVVYFTLGTAAFLVLLNYTLGFGTVTEMPYG